jgi:hypothetical protein
MLLIDPYLKKQVLKMKKFWLIFALIILPIPASFAQSVTENNPEYSPINESILSENQSHYRLLEKLLSQRKWRLANDETLNLLLKVTNSQGRGWFSQRDVPSLNCEDLRLIDQLWIKHSQGRFGFTPQLEVFLATGNRPGRMNTENYHKFGEKVGWRRGNEWIIFYENLNFTDNAPVGHLPNPRLPYSLTGGMLEISSLAKRIVECQPSN